MSAILTSLNVTGAIFHENDFFERLAITYTVYNPSAVCSFPISTELFPRTNDTNCDKTHNSLTLLNFVSMMSV